jgi:hypothetical protein
MPKATASKSNTKKKDSKAPKRPRNAYILFSSEKRAQLKVSSFISIDFLRFILFYFRVKILD